MFKAHLGLIRSIAWLEDDTGFISSGWDASIYMWKLNLDEGETNPIWDYKLKNVNFTCVQSFRAEGSKDPCVYATGTDKSIRELTKGEEERRYEQSVTLN